MFLIYLLTFVSIAKANIFYDLSQEQYNEVKNSRNFTGKVVLVTGSNSGIGEGIVKLFSILGAEVVVTGRNATGVKRVAQEVHELSPHGFKPLEVVADITKSEDLSRLLNETIKKYGKLDVLVNNAGIYPFSLIRDPKFMAVFDQVFNTDLRPVVELIHLSVPYLEKTNGSIISISSIAALRPSVPMLAYNCAKAAMDMMSRVLALELGPRIRVNTINPGATVVSSMDFNNPLIAKLMNQTLKATPLKRFGQTLDIAKGVAFLASTDASFITGANLVIDGGLVYNEKGNFFD